MLLTRGFSTSLSYAVYLGILSVLLIVIYLMFPETKNLTIEEISRVFDKDAAVIPTHPIRSQDDLEQVTSIRDATPDKASN